MTIKAPLPPVMHSYRLWFLVETIGSIAYLSRHWKELKKNVLAGFVLSCVGDERAYSHVQSPFADKLSDFALEAALISKPNVKTYSFLERGSDERQFCSPDLKDAHFRLRCPGGGKK